ncbi:MAG: Mut7-C RNAse domain-containing protein [Lentisphaeria bacterium]
MNTPSNNRIILRFYEELNNFLPSDKQKTAYSVDYLKKRSVKDLIESQGVPHTEVDLIVVNDQPVDFNYLVKPRDRIAVFPKFEALDITPLLRPNQPPLRDPRFIADVHLGKLARHLRLLGFDCLYYPDCDDCQLAEKAVAEQRILLTRDVGLLKRAIVTHGIFLHSDKPAEQLRDIIRRLQLQTLIAPFSRCVRCNGRLQKVNKENIRSLVPPRTYRHIHEFVQCINCGKVYWKGTHWNRLNDIINHAIE